MAPQLLLSLGEVSEEAGGRRRGDSAGKRQETGKQEPQGDGDGWLGRKQSEQTA